ncbi:MAG: AAA family ATPase [Solirubrobacterales bacterium]|nr:AAA family ATPase [Solirubrobacterales bacterium]
MAGVLLGRERELAEIEVVIDAARAGCGGLVVVEGPAAIGKTRLIDQAASAAQAAPGMGVLRARGSEFEAEMGFGVARQIFEPMLRAASGGERRRLLGGVARIGAQSLGLVPGEPPGDRFAAIYGLYWLCANRVERGPLVVAVDDVQWADGPSLAWLGYLARRVGDLQLALVLGLRSGDPGGEREELAHLIGDGGARRVVLGPLSTAAIGEIVRGQLDAGAEEAFCLAVSELSGGNPLFVRELLAAAREEGLAAREASVPALKLIAPAAMGTSVLARLGRLGDESVALARAVAVLDAGTEVAVAARLAGLDLVVAELTADRLAAAQVFAPVRPLEFFHPLIGAAVSADMAPGARRVAHRRAAELLDAYGEASLARVAAHLLACGPAGDGWVIGRLRDAARESLDRGVPEAAASYLRRALSEPPSAAERAPVLFMLGAAEWRAGQPAAIAQLEQALDAEDPGTLIAACSLLALAYGTIDRSERAIEVLERALAAVGDTYEGQALVGEAAIVLAGWMNERTAPAALQRAERLRGRLRPLSDPPALLLVTLAYHAANLNHAEEAQELAQRALAYEPYPPPVDTCMPLIITLILIENYDAVHRLLDEVLPTARRYAAMRWLVGLAVSERWRSATAAGWQTQRPTRAGRWSMRRGPSGCWR